MVSAVLLSVAIQHYVMLNVVILNIIMVSVFMLNGIMLSVMVPLKIITFNIASPNQRNYRKNFISSFVNRNQGAWPFTNYCWLKPLGWFQVNHKIVCDWKFFLTQGFANGLVEHARDFQGISYAARHFVYSHHNYRHFIYCHSTYIQTCFLIDTQAFLYTYTVYIQKHNTRTYNTYTLITYTYTHTHTTHTIQKPHTFTLASHTDTHTHTHTHTKCKSTFHKHTHTPHMYISHHKSHIHYTHHTHTAFNLKVRGWVCKIDKVASLHHNIKLIFGQTGQNLRKVFNFRCGCAWICRDNLWQNINIKAPFESQKSICIKPILKTKDI